MAKAMAVADYIITESNNLRKNNPEKYYPISNLYLQKIMYFLNIVSLVEPNHSQLINDKFEKWEYGPVVPSVYREYESFGGRLIFHPVKHMRLFNNHGDLDPKTLPPLHLDQKRKAFINDHIKYWLTKLPSFLVNKSHTEPQWIRWKKDGCKRNVTYNNTESADYWSKHHFWEVSSLNEK